MFCFDSDVLMYLARNVLASSYVGKSIAEGVPSVTADVSVSSRYRDSL